MKVGDLVRNLSSESGLLGVIVDFERYDLTGVGYVPVVCWQDGRTAWVQRDKIKIIKDS